ncbi:RmlC-like jelly roll fold protein [Cordyceps fumosorosea ARSEF 2679]|uniref:RmlC-like jelly roll fold protein n=1 Tax=Cordyceps fumosorosea (strain ARSEF 2679) TaxID=1081104 RepID=A0A167R5P6_CORFA|nr:RmlC-like jelly roll fold protein [Cordyceps fumosorosea ARSEF 2679]OAA58294.1 RmlC-like jelly roll fold protein [Cordyceps fumosorosea ARSEF 2679]
MAAANSRTAKDIIAALNLTPHPEKGYFVETYRDTAAVAPHTATSADDAPGKAPRAASTYIYYLLEGAEGISHWHRVLDAVEVWHYYAGAPLRLSLSWDDGAPVRDAVLGADILAGQRPQVIVERGEWQHAQSLGDWTLVGCSVAPGFEFEGFEMAKRGWEPRGESK